ncbi:MAG: hypothetical protein Kow00124_27060 [Anaerolineae bacterium]
MTIQSTQATLQYWRDVARDLLNEFDAADGLASYYTLHHDPKRTTLTVHRSGDGVLDGFLACCQTGIDLFRPLVTLRLRGVGAEAPLIREALAPGRPYLLVVPEPLVERLKGHLEISDPVLNRIMRLDPARFQPEINALVIRTRDRAGNPRAEIRRGDEVLGAAGVNWRSPIFAEVYVQVSTEHQRQGLGRSLVNAVAADLLKLGVTPLYNAALNDKVSLALAEKVGFVDTGARELMAQARRIG